MELLKAEGGVYNLQTRTDGQAEIFRLNTPVAIPDKGHFDYPYQVLDMEGSMANTAALPADHHRAMRGVFSGFEAEVRRTFLVSPPCQRAPKKWGQLHRFSSIHDDRYAEG
jgi:hypothetical protein